MGAVGCDVPAAPAGWDTTWIVPAGTIELAIDSILPAGVFTAPDGTVFLIRIPPRSASRTLGELCGPPCRSADGTIAENPAFDAAFEFGIPLPAGVRAATLAPTTLPTDLRHTFDFDPLRPGAGRFGSLTLTVPGVDATLAADTLDGRDAAFPPDTMRTRALPVSTGAVADRLTVAVEIESPAGDSTRIDAGDRLTVSVEAAMLRADDIEISGLQVEFETPPVIFRLQTAGPTARRVRRGALLLHITNPLDIAGRIDLVFDLPEDAFVKTIDLRPGTTDERLDFDAAELDAILRGDSIALRARASLRPTEDAVTVNPHERLTIVNRIELVLRAGR